MATAFGAPGISPALASSPPRLAAPASGRGAYVLTATDSGAGYEPTFTGNGELGVKVPGVGQGCAGGSVPAQSKLAGLYAQPSGTTDVLRFPSRAASFVRLQISGSSTSTSPMLEELTVTG